MPKIVKIAEFYGTGRRKSSVARVYLRSASKTKESGTEVQNVFDVNKKELVTYFPRESHRISIQEPLKLAEADKNFDIMVRVCGGGCTGQAEAIQHGLARALMSFNPELRAVLKKAGFLTRDSRIKERKKYGQRGARARYQFSKR
ncbi:MAG: 30S ribosomal protein S9 [Deltaproteobacteria bacterium]|nr:30S ribosomal protein S9 [Deltaproteobacteria bacterium]